MNDCQPYEALMAERLFGALGAEEKQRLEAHLEACPGCRAAVAEMEATLRIVEVRPRPEPAPAFWDGYYERLLARMHWDAPRRDGASRLAAWWRQPGRLNVFGLGRAPRWAVQGLAAVVLLLAGVFVGWLVFGPDASEAPRLAETPPAVEVPVEQAALEARKSRYLERSKVLLLGLVNLDPSEQTPALMNLDHRREVARELIEESSLLRDELSEADEKLLRVLIEDLEVILLQIANLEAGYDLPAIEMVQRGVDRRAILLKINLTEMHRADAAVQPAAVTAPDPGKTPF